jgi:hypothetical protein
MLDPECGTRFSSARKCDACGLKYWFGLAIKTPPLHGGMACHDRSA